MRDSPQRKNPQIQATAKGTEGGTKPNQDPEASVGRNMGTILQGAEVDKVVAACNRLSEALEAAAASATLDLPEGIRGNFHRVAAILAFPTWDEVVRWGAALNVDLRDLNQKELSHLERVSLKLVQKWRTDGTGPPYRNKPGIRYSLRDVWDWRRRGRQTMTAQGARRGRKESS